MGNRLVSVLIITMSAEKNCQTKRQKIGNSNMSAHSSQSVGDIKSSVTSATAVVTPAHDAPKHIRYDHLKKEKSIDSPTEDTDEDDDVPITSTDRHPGLSEDQLRAQKLLQIQCMEDPLNWQFIPLFDDRACFGELGINYVRTPDISFTDLRESENHRKHCVLNLAKRMCR